uniref:Mitochondrial import inner membrane translocase subunit TIM50 n=1 Tax=Cucumis melo TaxID=3656 RepID=A0A9I9EDX4_CUCME
MLKSLDDSQNPDSKPNENDVLSCAQGLIRVSSLRHFDQINGEVVADSFQQLSFGPVHEEVNSLSIFQPPLSRPPNCQMRKKLLVLDINGVLVDIVSPPPKERKADINIARHADFMKFCFERFEIGIWSSRNSIGIKSCSSVMNYIKQDLSHCAASKFKTLENKHKCLVFKQLRRLWEKQDPNLPWKEGEYNESNTLLLDDSPYKSLLNPPHSAVFPYSYTFLDEEKDTSLGTCGDLRIYLEGLAEAENVQKYVGQNPFGQSPISEGSASWDFYHMVLDNYDSFPSTI